MPSREDHLDIHDIGHRPGLPMPKSQRRKLLKEWAARERQTESDVVARIALDEIEELDIHIYSLNEELNRAKAAGFRG